MIKPLGKVASILLIITQTILPILTNGIEAAQDTQQSIQTHQWSQTGLRVKVESPIIDAVQKISDSYKRAKESDDTRLKALYAIRGGQQAYDTYNQYSNSQNNGGSGAGSAIQVKIGYSNTRERSETITQSNTTVSSDINAQGNVSIKATGDPNANKGDLAVVGSNIQGKNVSLEAARDIALQSSADTFDSASRNSSSHFSAGIVIGSSGIGVYAEGARGRGKENEDSVTHKETTVTATDALTINSGQDTNLKGAIAKGQTIKADVGRNLNIESEQDTSTYKARQQNMSGSAQVTYGGGGNASASYMQSKTDADYKSVQEQSGLFAGNGGYDIKVAKNTDLKGAVIASDATADKNTLTTETLTYSDISNRSKYSASSFGGSISASWSGGGNSSGGGNTGTNSAGSGARSMSISGAPMLGMPSSDSASGTTRSAVAPGTINTTSNIASLSRDTKNANGSVKNIFDKKKVATDQEVAQVFSEVAYHAVGDIAKSQTRPYEDAKLRYEVAAEQSKAAKQSGDTEKQRQAEAAMAQAQSDMAANQSAYDTWKDGSPAKIALHTLVGTLAAAMGKGDIAGGALGAGVSEAMIPVIDKQLQSAGLLKGSPEYDSLMKIASTVIGGAVGVATGGGNGAMSGGATALSATTNNYLNHYQIEAMAKELEKCKSAPKCKKQDIIDKYQAISDQHDAELASCATVECQNWHIAERDKANKAWGDLIKADTNAANTASGWQDVESKLGSGMTLDGSQLGPIPLQQSFVGQLNAHCVSGNGAYCNNAVTDSLKHCVGDQCREVADWIDQRASASGCGSTPNAASCQWMASASKGMREKSQTLQETYPYLDVLLMAPGALQGLKLIGGRLVALGERGAVRELTTSVSTSSETGVANAVKTSADDAVAAARTAAGAKTNETEIIDGLAFRKDLPNHLINDGFKNGKLYGTHNQDEAIAALDKEGINYRIEPTDTPGISEIKYGSWNARKGRFEPAAKTVYDPNVYSDEKMLEMAQEAGKQGYQNFLKTGNQKPITTVEGIKFRVYINQDKATGSWFVSNAHPIR